MPPTAATSFCLPLPPSPSLGPAMHVADCPCTAICAQQQQQQQLLQQTATVGRRVISFTQTQTQLVPPLPPCSPAPPPPTPALFYLSVGSRHSQLPFRIELNSNFYQFTKATAGKAKKGSRAASVGGQGRSYKGMRGVSGEVCAQPRNINDGKESWQQSF